jgi:hypothetical protein
MTPTPAQNRTSQTDRRSRLTQAAQAAGYPTIDKLAQAILKGEAEVTRKDDKMAPSYWHAIALIADNDEPTLTNTDDVYGMASTAIISALFDKPQEKVAEDVVNYRTGHITLKQDAALRRAGIYYMPQEHQLE